VTTTFELGKSSRLSGFCIFRSQAIVRTPASVSFLIIGIGWKGLKGPSYVVVTSFKFFSFIFLTTSGTNGTFGGCGLISV
jgi:hypothetical protein